VRLYYFPTSPYVRKVTVTAIELGIEGGIERVQTNVWDPSTEIGQANPLGKVPALVIENGDILFDSPVICEYLTEIAGGDLFPPPPARWQALRLQVLADGILDAAVLRVLEGRRPEARRSADWDGRQKRAIVRALDVLEAEIASWPKALTIGQIAAGCALGYLDFRLGHEDWRQARPGIADWYARFSQRPSMQATIPKDPAG